MSQEFFNKERISRQINELAELRYKRFGTVEAFIAYEDDGEIGLKEPHMDNPLPMYLGDRWRGMDRYLWLCFTVVVPAECAGQNVLGIFDFGITGEGVSKGFESLLYLDGETYQGVDTNHKEVFFPLTEGARSFDLKFRLWTGLVGGGKTKEVEHQLKQADLAVLDASCDKLYYLAKNVLETVGLLSDYEPSKTKLWNELVKSFQIIDFSEPGSEEFYDSVRTANRYLQGKMDGREKLPVEVSLVGHTHIDVAWLWRLRHTREKAVRSFSTVNRLMERYPDYKFLQTQAQLYEYIKEDYPKLFEMIKQRVSEKRWEPSGSMWVECDCNLTSGESIVRQILYGKQFFEKEFGYTNDFLWLPDVFGYSWALPQILRKSEINTFVTTKISWNDTNKLPFDTFKWRGIDGSEVTAHFITAPEHSANRYYTYNGMTDPYTVKGVWDGYANKDLNTELLIAYGYGDGGGGVNRDMLENISCIKKIAGLPNVKTTFAKEYLDKLNETIAVNERGGFLPIWDGELYLEFHRGTYTSQAYNKKTNRQLEFMIRDAEMLSVLAMLKTGANYESEKLFEAWKIIMRNQFHDIIPGSSIHEVYEDCHVEYAEAERILREIIDDAAAYLTKKSDDSYTVFNTLDFDRTTLVALPDGTELLVEKIPALSSKTVKAVLQESKSITVTNGVSSEFYEIVWNESGQLTSVFDKKGQREVLKGIGNVLHVYEDKPHGYDAWELDAAYENKCETIEKLTGISARKTPNYTCISFTWEYRKSVIKQEMFLYRHSARIDFKTFVDWQDREKLLKVDFPVNIRATEARYDIQFGNVSRPITRNTSWERAKFEVVAHKWVDLSETGYGVALLNDCKYGHSIKDHVISLTLLKSSNYPDYEADKGEHSFTYALYPHTLEWYESNLIEEAFDLNVHPIVIRGEGDSTALFTIENRSVTVDAVKKAEDSNAVILRMHEQHGSRGRVLVKAKFSYEKWCECNLMEHDCSEYSTAEISVAMKPYEIKTIKIVFS